MINCFGWFSKKSHITSVAEISRYGSLSDPGHQCSPFTIVHRTTSVPFLPPGYVSVTMFPLSLIFVCVMGLLLYRYLLVELSYENLSLPRLAVILDGIRLAVVKEGEKKACIVVEEMTAEQSHIFSALQLDRFVPK